MRTGMQVLVAAALLGASATAALAQGPYDDSSYWAKVERWQDRAWHAPVTPYPPVFPYAPGYSRYYGPPAVQYYAPPPTRPWPYRYSYDPYNPYYYR
jgi:hypothetical protein